MNCCGVVNLNRHSGPGVSSDSGLHMVENAEQALVRAHIDARQFDGGVNFGSAVKYLQILEVGSDSCATD